MRHLDSNFCNHIFKKIPDTQYWTTGLNLLGKLVTAEMEETRCVECGYESVSLIKGDVNYDKRAN